MKHGLHVYYCSEACQQRDWKVHKKTCGPKYDGTLDALDQMTLDDTEVPSSQLGSFGDFVLAPMHLAAYNGHEAVIQALIAGGADFNSGDGLDGATPLFIAARESCEAAARALIAAGAEINKVTSCGQTPLIAAMHDGHTEMMRLLIDAGADVNKADNRGITPLDVASHLNHDVVARMLRDAGARLGAGTVI